MGKVSDWLIEMEEDASYMTRQEFIDKHGETVIDMYDELQLKWQYDSRRAGGAGRCGLIRKTIRTSLVSLTNWRHYERQIDEMDWNDKPVTNATRNEAKRLTNMLHRGELWEPKF